MKKLGFLLILLSIFLLQFCSSSKNTGANNKKRASQVTYTRNIQPTLINNCSPCHFPPKGFKKPLDNYDSAKASIDEIIRRIQLNPGERHFMPFKHNKLSDSVIHIFIQWKTDGLLAK